VNPPGPISAQKEEGERDGPNKFLVVIADLLPLLGIFLGKAGNRLDGLFPRVVHTKSATIGKDSAHLNRRTIIAGVELLKGEICKSRHNIDGVVEVGVQIVQEAGDRNLLRAKASSCLQAALHDQHLESRLCQVIRHDQPIVARTNNNNVSFVVLCHYERESVALSFCKGKRDSLM
jgi:hypothetical protein